MNRVILIMAFGVLLIINGAVLYGLKAERERVTTTTIPSEVL